ncbi:TPA: UDP-glucose/GDP-mannose dehydrogenase family protein [Candidatus Galligastranaerophilus faecipullorum]|nr:UDP-glucose/GDP-mannose dehydrogenase family protein [Candidatus Galligastranaerophilus faecipullorum]
MKVCVIGTGYVGLVAGACLAQMGNSVICVDKDADKIEKLKNGIIPIYEPLLDDLVAFNSSKGRLFFSCDLKDAVKKSQICFIAVGTPEDKNGCADLSSVYETAREIAGCLDNYKIIVNKSTVPVGTGYKIRDLIKSVTDVDFDIVSNPEFLKQGAAVEDFLKPDRVVIGSDSPRATKIMQELYAPHTLNGNPVMIMDIKSAEMAKYAANSFLALKISYINEIANICEKTGADALMVKNAVCADRRIGSKFFYAGIGFGGSCFPKDLKALINTANDSGIDPVVLKAAYDTNLRQRKVFTDKILKRFNNNLKGKTFGVWGLSFKPQTSDMREAPSITIINTLLDCGAKIKAFDPKAFDEAKKIFKDSIEYSKTSYEALLDADALLLLTEWHEFRMPDFAKMKENLKAPVIFDGRNQYDPEILKEYGFEYHCIGRKTL